MTDKPETTPANADMVEGFMDDACIALHDCARLVVKKYPLAHPRTTHDQKCECDKCLPEYAGAGKSQTTKLKWHEKAYFLTMGAIILAVISTAVWEYAHGRF